MLYSLPIIDDIVDHSVYLLYCPQKEMVFLSTYHVLGCANVLPKCGMWDHMHA